MSIQHRKERGATMVEMALVIPLLFLLTLGAIELGRGVWTKHTLTHLAREAARYAAVRSTLSDEPATAAMIETRAKTGAVGINTKDMTVQTTWTPSNAPGGTVRVQVSYAFHPITMLIPAKTIQLTSNSERLITY